MPENNSINIFDLIDSICADFRRHWKSGKRPRIEDFLLKVSEDARANLFKNILLLDIRYRQRASEQPSSKDYLGRFPQFRRLIGDAFLESTSMSMEELHGTPRDVSDEMPVTVDAPNANQLGDYELIRELGRGGFGVVYEAHHTKSGNRVALKTLPTGIDGQQVNADRLYRFRREFRTLSEINHPNLVGMQSLEVDGSQWFFTMDLIDGEDFLSYVRPGNELDESRLRSCLSQLAQGVISLHRRGIIHRDLKPSNVLVSREGHISILDFGLAAELQRATDMTQTRSGMFAGTPRYAAPEQMFGERTEASDWYALGTMLYEALTGQPPFYGKDHVALLRQKQELDPPSLAGHDNVPADLAELADGLVRRVPIARLTAEAIGQRLMLDQETRTSGSTQGSHASTGSVDDELEGKLYDFAEEEIVLIGREEQLAQLESIKDEFLETQQPQVVWITGLSGEGKSSLAEKFLRPLRLGNEVLVLSGRCYDRESVPYKAIDCLIESLVSFLRSQPGKRYSDQLPEGAQFLAVLFPLLNRVEAIANRTTQNVGRMEPEKIRDRAFYALQELLATISRKTPLVVLADDLQWGDADSAQILADLIRSPAAPAMLFVGSYRSDEAADSPFLQSWSQLAQTSGIAIRTVEVAPLSLEQCVQLAVHHTGADRDLILQHARELFEDSNGNPYFLEQLLEGFDPQTGSIQRVPLDQIIARRLEKLSPQAASLLHVIAVSGQPLMINEASQAAGCTGSELGTLTHMRSERLVRLIGGGDQARIDTFHDKIRETVVAGLSIERRRQLHLELAETILSTSDFEPNLWLSQYDPILEVSTSLPPLIYNLAHHFDQATDPRSFVYQFAAGVAADRKLALQESQEYFLRAEALVPNEVNTVTRFRIYYGLGLNFMRSHDSESALCYFSKALEIGLSPLARARCHAGIGMVHQQAGRIRKALDAYTIGLEQVDVRFAKSALARAWRLFTDTIRLVVLPSSWAQSKKAYYVARAELEYKIGNALAVFLVDISSLWLLQVMTHQGIVAQRTGDRELISASYKWVAASYSFTGLKFLFRIFDRRATNIGRRVESSELQAIGDAINGCAHYFSGNLRQGECVIGQGLELLKRFSNTNNTMLTAHLLRHTRALLSPSSFEQKAATELIQIAESLRDPRNIAMGHYGAANALARRGNLADAFSHLQISGSCFADEPYPCIEGGNDMIVGYALMQASCHNFAKIPLKRAWRLAEREWYIADLFGRALCLWIECEIGPNWMDRQSTSRPVGLTKLLRKSKLVSWMAPNLRPHVARLNGRAAIQTGHAIRSVKNLEKAVALARTQEMNYELSRALLDLAAVKEENREENRAEAIELLKKMESVIPRAESWLLGDQYDEAVVAPEFDIEAWDREHGNVRVPELEHNA